MKILAASDIHGERKFIDELVKKAKEYDVDLIIIAGDITHLETKLEGIIGNLKKAGKPIFLVPGNEESFATVDFLISMYTPGVYNIHGYWMKFKDIGIIGVGGATKVGPNFITENEVKEILEKGIKYIRDSKVIIVVSHEPPDGSKLELGFGGSKALREFIEKYKPHLVITGHIHESAGFFDIIGKTLIINPGPLGVVVDLEKMLKGEVDDIRSIVPKGLKSFKRI